jgi:proteasome lid subunit RPN8/RPN11
MAFNPAPVPKAPGEDLNASGTRSESPRHFPMAARPRGWPEASRMEQPDSGASGRVARDGQGLKMESSSAGATGIWGVPECAFEIEYSNRVLDDIRLAVTDAFFSLPKGGAEIGGVLLGKWEDGRVRVLDYAPLECEHALGPSFTLSENDHARLAELAAAERSPEGMRAVGWYHSHTRSEIFLSEADLAIHKRYFAEPWQVALVLKPHTFRPMRCGFFFREDGEAIHAEASYQEFELTPLPVIATPRDRARRQSAVPPPPALPEPEPVRTEPAPWESEPPKPAVPVPVEAPKPEPPPPPAPPEPSEPPVPPEPEQLDLPYDRPLAEKVAPEAEPLDRPWPGRRYVFSAALLLVAATACFETRYLWMPAFQAIVRPLLPAPPPPSLGLNAIEANSELQIRWDRNSPAVRTAVRGSLEIRDGGHLPQNFRLDATFLRSGVFLYARSGQRVDVALVIDQPDGQQVREVASYLGERPARSNQSLKDVRKELLEQQRRRLRNQLPEPGR